MADVSGFDGVGFGSAGEGIEFGIICGRLSRGGIDAAHFDAVPERAHDEPGVLVNVEGDGGVDGIPVIGGVGGVFDMRFGDFPAVDPAVIWVLRVEGCVGGEGDAGIVFSEAGDGVVEVVGSGKV